jgi:hypothetical protein
MNDEIYRSQFRLPHSLYELLKSSADENRRSVNAELVARLEESFQARASNPATVGELMDNLMQLCEASGRSIQITFGDSEEDDSDEP